MYSWDVPPPTLYLRLICIDGCTGMYHLVYSSNPEQNERPSLFAESEVRKQTPEFPLYEFPILEMIQRNLYEIRCTCFNTVGQVTKPIKETVYHGGDLEEEETASRLAWTQQGSGATLLEQPHLTPIVNS